ncbi:DICT sensory domain-containing protein [Brasilonema sp. UFV-L1]|uniref:DICT sensory domain-containing protein n=1 Tax=Brasilonema sp. UFV-L1 TaxID=2234130 RepID=UPI00145F1765|nr:DICT sensory domain-containing protein [Brasilonema sp. UFV-L1]NMG10052.1 ATPase [Brasilonema sp. UFV-L1]
MNFFFAQDVSVYQQLTSGMQTLPQFLPHSPATLLSLLRSQVDLLIEQQIAATLWIKLPPGKIWHSEIQRYHQQLTVSDVIRTLRIEESKTEVEKEGEDAQIMRQSDAENCFVSVSEFPRFHEQSPPSKLLQVEEPTQYVSFCAPPSSPISLSSQSLRVQILPNSLLQREYFVMVLSSQFCCLILAHRPFRKGNNSLAKASRKNNPPLLAVTTFEGQIIQQALDIIKQAITPESSLLIPADFICPPAPSPTLMSQLLAKQLQRQDEIHRQITMRRVARMQQKNQKLHEMLQLKDEYLSNVCQELRAPLTHMKTALSLLSSPHLKPTQRQRYFQMLKQECDRQNALITGVMDLVQLERDLAQMPLEIVRLSEVVPGVVSIYQPLAREKGIMIAYTVPTELPAVWCVSGGLRQIVINLLSNSLKFTSIGGQVWVQARVQGDYVQLEFRDTGIGITDSEIPKIFDRFYRLRSTTTQDPGGVGLGLSIVQLLLCRCSGSVSVKSKLCEGSTFTVRLAIASVHPPQESI